jgi:glutaredoxin
MKKLKYVILTILMFILFTSNAYAEENIRLYLFHSATCTHCQAENTWLDEIQDEYPYVDIVRYEINNNVMNYNFYLKVVEKTGINTGGAVPFTIIGTDYVVGFSDDAKNTIIKSINKFSNGNYIDVISMIKNDEDVSNIKYNQKDNNNSSDYIKTIPILGSVNIKEVSLPLLSIVIGFVDGFNPCAMWVLLFLIGMLFNMKDKKKMWILGIVFLTTSACVYLAIMLAWLKVAISFNTSKILKLMIALVALIAGAINIRSYIKEKKKKDNGCEVVDEKKRKKIFSKIKKITTEKKFIISIVGIMMLAVSVNLVELACSAGLPLIFTQTLALNDLNTFQYGLYLFLYLLFFLIDDIVVFVIAMKTLNIKGISSKYGKYSHLIGGIFMILIGLLMIFKPEWLMFNFK